MKKVNRNFNGCTDERTDERTYGIWIAMCLHEHSFRRHKNEVLSMKYVPLAVSLSISLFDRDPTLYNNRNTDDVYIREAVTF